MQAVSLTVADDYAAPTEARAELDGFDTVCNASGAKPTKVQCKAFRAIDGGQIVLDYRERELRIEIVSESCPSGKAAVERTSPGSPLALALPWTLNRYKGSCAMPSLRSLPRGTGEFEKFVQLMTAKR
jgi:hypothetical protein